MATHKVRFVTVRALLVLAALACTLNPLAPEPPPGAPSPAPDTPPTPEQAPQPSLDARPLVWFAPLPPMTVDEGRPFTGSDDFMQLFVPEAPWMEAAGRVHVFKLYGEWVAYNASDAELRQVVDDVRRRGMALAVEAGPLTPDGCGEGIEGFPGIDEGRLIARRIRDAGGTLDLLAFDEPFAFAHLYDGPNACQWDTQKIAQDVAEYVAAVHEVFPDAILGDTEPLWAGVGVDPFEEWMLAYEAVTGAPLPFFHLDVDFTRQGWEQDALELEAFAREHGVAFGIIYLGDPGDATDEEWLRKAEERIAAYESLAGGQPDHVLFQSWHDHPDRVLPESLRHTWTNFVNRYFRARTSLEVTLERAAGGQVVVGGSLLAEDGAPLAGRAIEYGVTPLEGEGVFGEYTLAGVVPVGATVADVGLRVNQECGCTGPSDLALYGVRYVESGGGDNRVPNFNFGAGLDGWDLWGDSNARLEASDRGAGSLLHVSATSAQTAGMNSADFPVTAGAPFEVTFSARVSPDSAGSGYFSLVFLNATREVGRQQIPLQAKAAASGSTTTGDGGAYTLTLGGMPPAPLSVALSYAGDDGTWPVLVQVQAPGG